MTETSSLFLARRIRTTDLRGPFGNQLDVPQGQQATVILPDGSVQTLPAGRQTVPGIKVFGPKPQMALMPAGEFSLLSGAPRLPTGDAQHVDASFAATLRVGNPGLFVVQLLNERETLTEQDLIARLTTLALPFLSDLTKAYTAADLCGPTPVADHLMAELRGRLTAPLAELGMQLIGVRYLTFKPAQTIDEQTQALQALQAEVASGTVAPSQLAQIGLPTSLAGDLSELSRLLDLKLAGLSAQITGRLDARLKDHAKSISVSTPASERWERIAKILQIISALLFILTIGLRLILPVFVEEQAIIRTASQIFGALGTAATAIGWLVARRQAQHYRLIELTPVPLLDRVSQYDRTEADQMVREQLSSELTQIARTLKSAREKVYTQGHERTALTLGQTLKEIEKLNHDVITPTAGAPAYLTKPRVSLSELAAMLDYDEDLLTEATALDDEAQTLVKSANQGEEVAAQAIATLNAAKDLQYHFASRARFLQTATRDNANPPSNIQFSQSNVQHPTSNGQPAEASHG